MEKQAVLADSPEEIEEVFIEDVSDEKPSAEPPAGFEDMLYEAWRDKQLLKNDKPDPDEQAVSV
ncbi:MAG: hypothetical protein AB1659_11245 [Thermodesulfobacteriota bacterium]